MNQIRKIVQAKIDNIIQLSETVGDIKHGPSVGVIRESYLISFFKDLIPNSVSLTSGFITDAAGNVSPQIDLIVTKDNALPLLKLKEELSIVPLETVILVAEIKSNLTIADLSQIETQVANLTSMGLTGQMGAQNFIIPNIILAYDTSVKEETLIEWMKNNGNTVACCIFKKNTLMKDENILVFKNDDFGIKHHGVLAFVATFYEMLEYLCNQRDHKPNLHTYLTGRPRIE